MYLSDTITELNNARNWIGVDYKGIQHSQMVKDESSGVSNLVHFGQRASAVLACITLSNIDKT